MSGVAEVQARVQEIQTQIAALAGRTPVATSTASSGVDFASTLAAAQQQAGTVAGATSGISGASVVQDAQRYLGVPYAWGGTDPSTGLDCSGLVQRVYADLGVTLPRVSRDQAQVGQPVASLAAARPGDILAFGQPVDHVAIYIGNGKMIAAPEQGESVKVQDVYTTPTAIRRVLPGAPASLGTPGVTGGGAYGSLFSAAESKYGLPSGLLAAVAQVESGDNPNARSSAGALGLMQLMPSTALGLGVNPLDPAQAVDGAARLLARNLGDFGSVPLALAAYNAGAGAVHRYGGIPPYAQTQSYVQKVQAAMAALQTGAA